MPSDQERTRVGQSADGSFRWIRCSECGNKYPVGGHNNRSPVETSPESAEHHEEGCSAREALRKRGQTADRAVHADTDRSMEGDDGA